MDKYYQKCYKVQMVNQTWSHLTNRIMLVFVLVTLDVHAVVVLYFYVVFVHLNLNYHYDLNYAMTLIMQSVMVYDSACLLNRFNASASITMGLGWV